MKIINLAAFKFLLLEKRGWIFCIFLLLLCPTANLEAQYARSADSVVFQQSNGKPDLAWSVDSLMLLKLFTKAEQIRKDDQKPQPGTESMDLSKVPDIMFEYRFEQMNRTSVIHMDYNPFVRKYILLFGKERRSGFSRVLGLSEMYFPLFEEYLERYRLPLELKYLPVVESSLNPLARSNTDAIGLWQFKINASKMFRLEVNSLIDERMDPRKSTDAACQYLGYLYSIFHDWQLALAAFNGGPGVVRNAIQRSGGKTNFWEIREYMPQQTQDYVPAFMAAAYMMNYAALHDITPLAPDYDFWSADSVMISYPIRFSQVSEIIHVPEEALRFLNPMYKESIVPETGHPMILVLPADKVLVFLRHENDILGKKVEMIDYNKARVLSASTTNKSKFFYTVQPGDFLHKIAYEHDCTIEDIRAWNSLKNDSLVPGQQIVLWEPGTVKNQSQATVNPSTGAGEDTLQYIVRKGDTVYSIAAKFKDTTVNDIIKANGIDDEKNLKRGQTLLIPVKKHAQ